MTDQAPETAPRKAPGKNLALRPAATATPMALVPQTMDDAFRVAQAFHRGGLAPSSLKTPEAVFTAILAGSEIGLLPFQSLRSFAVINGNPTLWGDAIPALLYAHGFKIEEWFTNESDDFPDTMTAHCKIVRPDGTQVTRKFSVADAKRAKLWGKKGGQNGDKDTPWITYPSRMVQMRARSWAARDGAADVLRGIKLREEVDDYVEVEAVAGPGLDTAFREAEVVDAEVTEGAPAAASAETSDDAGDAGEAASASAEPAGDAENADATSEEHVDAETGEVTDGPTAAAGAAETPAAEAAATASPAGTEATTSTPTGPATSEVAEASAEGENSPPSSDASQDPAVDDFCVQVAKLPTWDAMRDALAAFARGLPKDNVGAHNAIRAATFEAASALESAPEVNADPWFFSLWLSVGEPIAADVRKVWSELIFKSAYEKLKDNEKRGLQDRVRAIVNAS